MKHKYEFDCLVDNKYFIGMISVNKNKLDFKQIDKCKFSSRTFLLPSRLNQNHYIRN